MDFDGQGRALGKLRTKEQVEYENELALRLFDGNPTASDARALGATVKRLGLSPAAVGQSHIRFCESLVIQVVDDGWVTEAEMSKVKGAMKWLGVQPNDLDPAIRSELDRFDALRRICAGELPIISEPQLIARKDETVHFECFAGVIENVRVKLGYQGQSQGFSIRLAKGLSYRVGQSQGQLQSEQQMLPVDDGTLSLTDRRVVYAGVERSFVCPWAKVISVEESDGNMVIVSEKQQKPLVLAMLPDRLVFAITIALYFVSNQD